MDAHVRRVFVFEGGTFEPLRGDLRIGTARATLRPRTATVLTYLLENAGRIVGREELIKQVWSDVVVTDDSLAQCIKEIRRALGAAADLIRTTPRLGYAFTGAVREERAEIATPTQEASAPRAEPLPAVPGPLAAPHAPRPRPRRARIAAGIVIGTLVVAALALVSFFGSERLLPSPKPNEPRLSIAVLPLVNVGGDSAQDWFAEGVTDDLTSDLSRIEGSFVISRGSAYTYKGKNIDARAVGRELGVRYLVEGDVRRVNAEVTLNVRLIDALSGSVAWSERFAGSQSTLDELHRSVTGRIARSLHLKLIDTEAVRAQRERPRNPDAHDLTMQGWSVWNRLDRKDNLRARQLFQQAVTLEPQAAMAWAGLANTYITEYMQGPDRDRTAVLNEAEAAARQGYRVNPGHVNTLGSWGTVLALRGRLEDALPILNEQTRLNRNYAGAWYWIGTVHLMLGDPGEAIRNLEHAIRLSPRDPRTGRIYKVLADAYLHGGDARSALGAAEHAYLLTEMRGGASLSLIVTCVETGQLERARRLAQELLARNPRITLARERQRELPGRELYLQRQEKFFEALRQAGLPEG